MRRTLTLPAVAAALALSLAACGGDSDSSEASGESTQAGTQGFDVSSVEENAEVSDLVPDAVAETGTLTVWKQHLLRSRGVLRRRWQDPDRLRRGYDEGAGGNDGA